jgi:DNA-binding GntR family transcriptional regulator
VREALRMLEREGLVHCARHRGTTVTTLSPEDVAELDSQRGALEQLAVQEVIVRLAVDVVSGTAGRLVDSATFAG